MLSVHQSAIPALFESGLGRRPYATDILRHGVKMQAARRAIRRYAYGAVREHWGAQGGFVHYLAGLQSWAIDFAGNGHCPPLGLGAVQPGRVPNMATDGRQSRRGHGRDCQRPEPPRYSRTQPENRP